VVVSRPVIKIETTITVMVNQGTGSFSVFNFWSKISSLGDPKKRACEL
jgi:hypothetical protein